MKYIIRLITVCISSLFFCSTLNIASDEAIAKYPNEKLHETYNEIAVRIIFNENIQNSYRNFVQDFTDSNYLILKNNYEDSTLKSYWLLSNNSDFSDFYPIINFNNYPLSANTYESKNIEYIKSRKLELYYMEDQYSSKKENNVNGIYFF